MPVTNHDLRLHTGNKDATCLPTGKSTERMKESREGYAFLFLLGLSRAVSVGEHLPGRESVEVCEFVKLTCKIQENVRG